MLLLLMLACRESKVPGSTIWCGDPQTLADADADGWHSTAVGGSDCDDLAATTHPEADDPMGDGKDTNCDGVDGVPAPVECPGTPETCDGIDEDCDGVPDDPFRLVHEIASTALLSPIGEGGALLLITGHTTTGSADGAVELTHIDGTPLVTLSGVGQGPSFGQQLAAGRDLTGDGQPDLVIAAPYATTDLGINTGRVWVLPGPLTAASSLDDAVGLYEGGELDGQAGTVLALTPDLTGDGRDELLIGQYRHVLLFSGAPAGTVLTAGAALIWELNTGGGAWHFGVDPRDITRRPDLLLGMDTYNDGAGVVLRYDSRELEEPGRRDLDDAALVVEGAAGQALGNRVTGAADSIWSVDVDGLVEVAEDGTTTARVADVMDFGTAGDADGDGDEDLLLERPEALWLWDESGALAIAGGQLLLQTDRAVNAVIDVDADGWIDPVVLSAARVAVLDGAIAFGSDCNRDGDAFSSAEDDCDDEAVTAAPGLIETCDGLDNDCDGAIDDRTDLSLGTGWRDLAPWAGVSPLVGLREDGLALIGLDGVADTTYRGQWSELNGIHNLYEAGTTTLLLGNGPGADLELWSGLGSSRATLTAGADLSLSGRSFSAGDLDGDGLGDAWIEALTASGGFVLMRLDTTLSGSISADDLDVHLLVPDTWTELRVAEVAAGRGSDLNGDGAADLLIGNPYAWGGDGRMMLALGRFQSANLEEADSVQLVGEPGEGLGVNVVMGGDLDDDGDDDALVGGNNHARLLTGGACVEPSAAVDLGGLTLVLADTDGSGTSEGYSGTPTEAWLGGENAGTLRSAAPGGDPTVLRGGDPGDLLGADLWVVGDLDQNGSDELVYSRASALWLLGLGCD